MITRSNDGASAFLSDLDVDDLARGLDIPCTRYEARVFLGSLRKAVVEEWNNVSLHGLFYFDDEDEDTRSLVEEMCRDALHQYKDAEIMYTFEGLGLELDAQARVEVRTGFAPIRELREKALMKFGQELIKKIPHFVLDEMRKMDKARVVEFTQKEENVNTNANDSDALFRERLSNMTVTDIVRLCELTCTNAEAVAFVTSIRRAVLSNWDFISAYDEMAEAEPNNVSELFVSGVCFGILASIEDAKILYTTMGLNIPVDVSTEVHKDTKGITLRDVCESGLFEVAHNLITTLPRAIKRSAQEEVPHEHS